MYIHWPIDIMIRVFADGLGDWSLISGRVILKKVPSCLTLRIIRYGLSVSGAIQAKEHYPPLHLGVVDIEKGAFESLLTTVSQLIYIYIYIYAAI